MRVLSVAVISLNFLISIPFSYGRCMNNLVCSININRSAQKEITALDAIIRGRILNALKSLTDQPRPIGCRKLVSAQNRWRVRVGDYRVIYEIKDVERVVLIVFVRHRSRAYE